MARVNLSVFEYSRTPIGVAVIQELGVNKLTPDDLARLLSEVAATFPNGTRARPVMRLVDATDTKLVQSFQPSVAVTIAQVTAQRGMLNANTDSEAADLVEKTPGAFAASTLPQILSEKRPLVALTVGDLEPGVANHASGKYPYFKPLLSSRRKREAKMSRCSKTFCVSRPRGRCCPVHGTGCSSRCTVHKVSPCQQAF
jgi:phosphate transport system substrate-binding protein